LRALQWESVKERDGIRGVKEREKMIYPKGDFVVVVLFVLDLTPFL